MRKILIIADKDEIFVNSLEEYILLNHGEEFEIRTYTNKDYLEKYFSTPKKVDILLINSNFEFKDMKNQYIDNIVFISNEESIQLAYDYIYRYGELDSICNKLRYINIKNDEIELSTNKFITEKAEVISIYSPIGGMGKSTIAISISIELSLKGNSILYINLENMPSINAYFKFRKTKFNLSHIIEQLNFDRNQLIHYLNESIVIDKETNISYINPVDNIFTIEQMNRDDIKYIINTIKELKRFNYIIIDTSSNYDTSKKSIMDASDKIIMPLGQNEISKQKTLNFLRFIDEEELHKFVPIINKYKEESINCIKDINIINSDLQIKGVINHYEALKECNDYISILNKHNSFTSSIKSLISWF